MAHHADLLLGRDRLVHQLGKLAAHRDVVGADEAPPPVVVDVAVDRHEQDARVGHLLADGDHPLIVARRQDDRVGVLGDRLPHQFDLAVDVLFHRRGGHLAVDAVFRGGRLHPLLHHPPEVGRGWPAP